MIYVVKIKNSLAVVQAEGYGSYITMPESQVWQHMKKVTRIAKSEGVSVKWEIKEE